ncbi:MAG: anthranilate phosphoribosyltransferase [bacterium]
MELQTPQEFIRTVSLLKDLTRDEAATAMEGIMEGEWTPAQIGAFITALMIKGEAKDEIVGSAQVMRAKAFQMDVRNRPLVDPVGSGGDGLKTINVSTLSGLVAAGAGVVIAKHGNRAMTGQCGSADFLEGIGVCLDIEPADAIRGIDENGFGFLLAPHFHQSMRHAIGPRKEIGIPTIFNHLGPLTNPVAPERQFIGVNRAENTMRFTEVLTGLGCEHSLVVHGRDGMDEITTTGETHVVEQKRGTVKEFQINPEDFAMERVPLSALTVAGKEAAIEMGKAVLEGKAPPEQENLVVLNAAAVIYLGAKAPSIKEGVAVARDTIKSGAAKKVAQRVADFTQSHKARKS